VVSSGDLYTSEQRVSTASDEGQDLRELGAKLEEIRKQRKKIFEDDIWNEI